MNAADILNHCEAVVKGEIPQPLPFWVEADYDGLARPQYIFYYAKPQDDVESHVALIFWGFAAQIPPHTLQLAARLLGIDKQEVKLEWEDVKYPTCAKSTTKFNDLVSCTVEDLGECVRAYVLVSGVGRTCMDPPAITVEDAQKWCADTIKAITTQTLKP